MNPQRAIARRLKEDGATVREIAEALGIPRSTVGELVVGVDRLPHASMTDDPPATNEAEAQRLGLLSKPCGRCNEPKTWSEYWAQTKWPDGTMRRPQAWCKECVKEQRKERRRMDPEWARAVNKADWARIKADPEKLDKRRELTRENGIVHRLRQRESA
jgi:hypothetical protein